MSTQSVRISETLLEDVRSEASIRKQLISTVIESYIQDGLDGGIVGKIKKDPELFDGWKANIAMAVKDEFSRYRKKWNKRTLSYEDMHAIANKAAENFLNLLIK